MEDLDSKLWRAASRQSMEEKKLLKDQFLTVTGISRPSFKLWAILLHHLKKK